MNILDSKAGVGVRLTELSELRRLRRKLGISQAELARRSGVSQSLIARVESGSVDPGYSKVLAILNALEQAGGKDTPASSVMSTRVHGISSHETVEKAAMKMKKYDVSQLPVYEGGRIVGSLSESAVVRQMASGASMKELSKRRVSSCMEDPLPAVSPNTPLSMVSNMLEGSPAVLLTEKGRVAGIVTKADLLKMLHS